MNPYYEDEHVTLYHGDMVEFFGGSHMQADAIVTDPPYGETSLEWDSWPYRWPALVSMHASSMWCFGSMRMFTDHWEDFTGGGWKLSQDVVWEKHNGSGFQADRFKRVHEHALHFYQGEWSAVYRDVQYTMDALPKTVRRKSRPAHTGEIGPASGYVSVDGGPRMQRSVIKVRSMHGRAIHPTEKPTGILDPLIRYSVPVGGLVLDPFAGSASTLLTARTLGRRAIGIEANEAYCEAAAKRLSVPDLFGYAVGEAG